MVSDPDKDEREMEPWQQYRRRALLGTAVLVCTLLAVLAWLLLHPSAPSSPARIVKNIVFGRRVTEAAEQYTATGTGSGTGQAGGRGQSDGASGPSGGSEGQSGQSGNGSGATGTGGTGGAGNGAGAEGGAGTAGGGQGEPGQGHGTPLTGPISGPANPHNPANNPGELAAPAARSIGWLDRFFGSQARDDVPAQAGEGGTGLRLPGAGNTNLTTGLLTNPMVAAERTESNPVAPAEAGLDEPPPPSRSTNRAAATSTTLNDNFEQLLRQHQAGSGDVRISLMWSNRNDLDLHVVDPSGEEIFFGHRAARSGGLLDIDMNASPPFRVPAVENVFWPQRAAPVGKYRIYVNDYRRNDSVDLTSFTVRTLVRGRTVDVTGSIRFGDAKKLVHQFTLGAPAGE